MSRRPNLKARERILESAQSLFQKRGFQAVSMGNIAGRAKIKKANLFHYYSTKEDLGLAVLDHAMERLKKKVSSELRRDGRDPETFIERMFSSRAAVMRENNCCGGCFIGNLAQELSDHHPKLRGKISGFFGFWVGELKDFLERGKSGGIFRKDFSPEESAEAILSLYEGAILFCKTRKDTGCLASAGKMAKAYLQAYRNKI